MRVMIVGKGKMGTRLAASAAEKGHAIVATVDRFNREALGSLACDAVIDFSHPDNLAWVCDYVEQQCCIYLCGTTGLNAGTDGTAERDGTHLSRVLFGQLLLWRCGPYKARRMADPAAGNGFRHRGGGGPSQPEAGCAQRYGEDAAGSDRSDPSVMPVSISGTDSSASAAGRSASTPSAAAPWPESTACSIWAMRRSSA